MTNVARRALGAEQDGFVSYGKFRNFLILLPEAKLREADPSIAWFEAATMVPFGEPPRPALTPLRLDLAILAATNSSKQAVHFRGDCEAQLVWCLSRSHAVSRRSLYAWPLISLETTVPRNF